MSISPSLPDGRGRALERHWDAAYASGDSTASWVQARPTRSLRALAEVSPRLDAPIIDVGGGSSLLASELLFAGHTDVTVLDLSTTALGLARARLGDQSHRVQWIVADVLAWQPTRRYGVWHDRAVLHFFTDPADRAEYAATLRNAVAPGGHAVIAAFAPDGPTRCSGLAVQRHSADDILELLGAQFTCVAAQIVVHRTPRGRLQPFTWVVAERTGLA